jgi:hypothetical protein
MALMGTALLALAGASTAGANGVPLNRGDVLAGVGTGNIKHFDSTGKLLDTLNTTSASNEDTGMCFDASGNLYATNFSSNTMSKFDNSGNLLVASFGSGFSEHPESCVFDGQNNVFVGQPDGSKQVLKFNALGTLLGSTSQATGPRGTDWVDLAPNGCTMSYTSEGSEIKRFNVCTNTQLSNFASGLPSPCYAHRILPDGGELVACTSVIERLNAKGEIIHTYTLPGTSLLFALNIDPDKKTFWTGDYYNGQVFRVDIETGAVVTTFNAGVSVTLAGLAVVGEVTSATTISLSPVTAENPVGTTHTVTAAVTEGGVAQKGVKVTFTVTGANPTGGTGITNEAGEASFTFPGKKAGTDTIVATFIDKAGKTDESNTATKIWKAPEKGEETEKEKEEREEREEKEREKREEEEEGGGRDHTTLSTSLAGGTYAGEKITVQEGTPVSDGAKLAGTNSAEATGTVAYSVYSDPTCTTLVTGAGTVGVSAGVVGGSNPETLQPGVYYWRAAYSGDVNNQPSTSTCGKEVLTVSAIEHPLEGPEFGRCVKVAKGTGAYSSGACTTAGGSKSYKWVSGVASAHFTTTLASGSVTLEAGKTLKVLCTGESGVGDYSGAKTVGNVKITFTGCTQNGTPCNTAGAAGGEAVTTPLGGALGIQTLGVTPAQNKIALDLFPTEGSGAVLQLTCGTAAIVVRGSVIVPASANKMSASATLNYVESKGKQKPESFVGVPKDVLEGSLNKGAYAQTGLKVKETMTSEEAVEINSVL